MLLLNWLTQAANRQCWKNFRANFPLSQDKWDDYVNRFKRIQVPARTILLHEGDISRKAYLIEKGCLRVWFDNKGEDMTVQFFFENNTVSSIERFKKGLPSLFSIETIEPCILWWIDKKSFGGRVVAYFCLDRKQNSSIGGPTHRRLCGAAGAVRQTK